MRKSKSMTVTLETNPKIKVNIVRKHSPKRKEFISEDDKDMDIRAEAAVCNAIKKAVICGKPIAEYDKESGKVSIVYADGKTEYIK